MVKRQHKVLSFILCLILAVSAVCAGTVGAFAASGDTIYFKPGHWTEASAWFSVYAWDGSGGETFVKMTEVESGVYGADLGGSYANVIFCRNDPAKTSVDWSSVWNQTADLTVQSGTNCFAVNSGEWTGATGTWSTYGGGDIIETTATTATTATTVTTPTPGDGVTVYLKNTAGWSTANCYMWNGSGSDCNASWPGQAMTNLGDNVWMYTTSSEYANCIFNAGNGGSQTADLTTMNGYIYDNSTNSWSVYDTSPIQVRSYSADPSTGVYVDTDVTLSATAVSTSGATVYYQFSVTNSNGGTSVISNYSSANSVIWTPTTTGTYTISFDFKDSDGNENNRTTTITVEDDSALVKPVIKSVFPYNANLIKVGSNTTVTVKAGGGITGTNLLFYKYIVTDPNGVQNTPYYTLNNTYSFTPSMVGDYTVNVYVQGSDNSTVNKTYEYTATTSDITNPTIIQPTTVAPTTVQPTTVAPTTIAPTTSPDFILGDVDGDGRLSIKDATYIQKYNVGMEGYETIDLTVGDVDGDGRVSVKDATEIQKLISA